MKLPEKYKALIPRGETKKRYRIKKEPEKTKSGKGAVRLTAFLMLAVLTFGFFGIREYGKILNEKENNRESLNAFLESWLEKNFSASSPVGSENVKIPEDAHEIRSSDMRATGENGLSFENETTYRPEKYANEENAVINLRGIYAKYGENAPVVLIVHTYPTQSYVRGGVLYCTEDDEFFSSDKTENIISVGKIISEVLTKNGINTAHVEETRNGYYDSARSVGATISEYIAAHPSVALVIDVQRDFIISGDGAFIAPETEIGGDTYAQFRFVVGTDYNGTKNDKWITNLALATNLQKNIASDCAGIAMPILLRASSSSQQYAPHSLTLRIGSYANTLESAKLTAALTAEKISYLFLS